MSFLGSIPGLGDVTGGITSQFGDILGSTGLTSVWETGITTVNKVVSGIGSLASNLLSGNTFNMILMIALGGVAIYGVSVISGAGSGSSHYYS
jgi:hypothetical protein